MVCGYVSGSIQLFSHSRMKFKATQTKVKSKLKILACSIIFGISLVGILLGTILKSKSPQEDGILATLRVQVSTTTAKLTLTAMTTVQATTDEVFLGCYNSSIGNV